MKLQELEMNVGRFYESDVAVFASEDNLVKLAGTKEKFELYQG